VIATVISLLEKTYIRIGNASYEKENGSYGLTTLKDGHVQVKNESVKFSFVGKKGIFHQVEMKNKTLAEIIKQCRDIPGKELFQYYDDHGKRHSVDSIKVNSYLQKITGENFTAKDFRTWAGSLSAIRAIRNLNGDKLNSSIKKQIVGILDCVSKELGNTRTVCKKYYVHPKIIELLENNTIHDFINTMMKSRNKKTNLDKEEIVLMKILEAA
jgi:DNA topoisomerase-1